MSHGGHGRPFNKLLDINGVRTLLANCPIFEVSPACRHFRLVTVSAMNRFCGLANRSIRVSQDDVSGDTDLILRAPLPTDPPILLFLADLMQKTKIRRRIGNAAASIPDLDRIFPAQRTFDAETGRAAKPL